MSPIARCRRRALTGLAALAVLSSVQCGDDPPTPAPTPIPPVSISCPPQSDAQSMDGSPVEVTLTQPQTTGGQAPVAVTCSNQSGPFPVGSTTVTCQATDARGQSASCNYQVAVRPPPRLRFSRFLSFGDSLTEGTVSLGPSLLLIVAPQSYPAQLERRLVMRYKAQAAPVVLNEGVGAEFTPDGLRRIRSVLLRHRPEVLLLMEGTNDLWLDTVRGPDTAITNLRHMIVEAKSLGVQVALATIPPQRAGGLRRRDPVVAIIPGFNDRVRALAAAENLVLVDVFAGMKDDLSLIGLDDLHPTERGYDVMAGIYFDAIQRAYEETPSSLGRMPY